MLIGSDRCIIINAQASKDTGSATILCDHSYRAVDRILRSFNMCLFSKDLNGTALNVTHSVLCAPTKPPKPKISPLFNSKEQSLKEFGKILVRWLTLRTVSSVR